MLEWATNLIVGFIIAVTTSWFTVRFSLGRFYRERLWDKKYERYTAIIESLHHMKSFCYEHLEASYEGKGVSKERDTHLRNESSKAQDEIWKARDIGLFIVHAKVIARLDKLQADLNKARNHQMWQEYLDAEGEAVSSCLKDIIEIAKSDLKIEHKINN